MLAEVLVDLQQPLLHRRGAEQVRGALSVLSDREREVLEMRFGLKDGQEHTLEEVGKHFGVTRERIRQIEAKALRKMRHPTRIRQLQGFLESEEVEAAAAAAAPA